MHALACVFIASVVNHKEDSNRCFQVIQSSIILFLKINKKRGLLHTLSIIKVCKGSKFSPDFSVVIRPYEVENYFPGIT